MGSFDAFTAGFHRHFTRNPNACVGLGVDERLDDLPDPSLEAARAEVDEARALLRAADEVDGELSFDERLDLDLARLALRRQIHAATFEFNGRTTLEQQPTAAADVGDAIFLLFVNDPRPAGDRLANVTARLEKVPAYLEALLGRLTAPVERWVAIDAERVAELPSLLDTLEVWAGEEGWADAGRLRAARVAAQNALEGYAEQLQALPTTRQLHVTHATAREIVSLRGIELSFDELHALAGSFLEDVGRTLEELGQRLATRYGLPEGSDTEAVHRYLNARFRLDVGDDFDRVLDRYGAELQGITRFIDERQLFPIPDDQRIRILRTPAFMAPTIPAGAMFPPPPFREGTRQSLVYLTLSKELLDEHTELGIPSMMIHEGIPGHHLQLATASMHRSVVRRHLDPMDQAEGWTTMLEDYMLDQGYMGELRDEARFSGKRDISRLGARVAIDLFFMTGDKKYLDVGVPCDVSSDDPFEAAGSLLAAVTGFVPARVQSELNWYSQERGYPLSYLAGNHLVWSLKRDVQAKLVDRDALEVDRAFHRAYLEAGNMPVCFLRRVFAEGGMV